MRVCPKCDLRHFDTSISRCLMCKTGLIQAQDPRVGTVLAGRYRLEEVIGEGGMAIVYLAKHTLVERPYAVKVLHGHFSLDDENVERMRREARMTAALTHPNILEIHDFGITDDGCPFIVMELLEGQPLRTLIQAGRIPMERLIDFGSQMARGLARAHDFGVVHRDLKPENVFVIADPAGGDLIKLVDFGIARQQEDTHLTHRGEIVGTPQYMAPDRALSADVKASCDLYSLGVVLYEMATGVLPFESNTPTGFVLKHIHETARPAIDREPSVPAELDRLIRDLMEKDPVDRPVDAHQVVERLSALEPDRPAPKPRPTLTMERPTLEHVSTLNGWQLRSSLFEHLVSTAYGDRPPRDVLDTMVGIRDGVGRLRALRERGVRAQRELDALEFELKKKGERLGHAVHVLAIDLSRAREEDRDAVAEEGAREDAGGGAKQVFDRRLVELEALVEERPEHPGDAVVEAARALAEAADEWQRADQAAARSKARAARIAVEVGDLEFQVKSLRAELQKLEQGEADEGEDNRRLLEANDLERRRVEQQLVEFTDHLVQPLRGRPDLAEIFVGLESAGRGAPAATAG